MTELEKLPDDYIPWGCPQCGMNHSGEHHSQEQADECHYKAHSKTCGFFCNCEIDEERLGKHHGNLRSNPCLTASCNHCDWEGVFPEAADPVDDYYKPLTREERDVAVRGSHPPYGELLGWIRRWEATVRALETENLQLGERVENAKMAINYSPVDEPEKNCDKIIWDANMRAHSALTEPMGNEAGMVTGIEPKGVDKSGKLELKIHINHHTGSVWVSREFWNFMATFWERQR